MNPLNNIHQLKREIDNWLSILEIWKNHLSFLRIRLRSLEERRAGSANTYQDLHQQTSYLIDSIIPDYQESLRHHKADLEKGNDTDPEPAWLEEHHLYHRHMRQLRSEYKQLTHKVLIAIEKSIQTLKL